MFRSWKLGTAFGIGIYIHWSFLILLGIVLYSTYGGGLVASAFWVGLVVATFSCIILHELGHALMARYFGIPTRDITMFPIGGVARLERMSERPFEEVCIALAGPAVNVVISAVLFGVLSVSARLTHQPFPVPLPESMTEIGFNVEEFGFAPPFLTFLMVTNIGLVVFNMIPAFPMDGGRVLRATLASFVGQLRATEIAAVLSLPFAMLIGLWGVAGMVLAHSYNPVPILVSLFVVFAGQQELAAVRYKEARRRQAAEHEAALAYGFPGDLPHVRVPQPPEPNFSGFTWDRHSGAWIEWRDGRPVHASWTHHSA
ncbi:MAG: site-2 protease family protein [Gemmataceae bacterium]|nr:site-2 protease family protein [Gemmataceae bacterium]